MTKQPRSSTVKDHPSGPAGNNPPRPRKLTMGIDKTVNGKFK